MHSVHRSISPLIVEAQLREQHFHGKADGHSAAVEDVVGGPQNCAGPTLRTRTANCPWNTDLATGRGNLCRRREPLAKRQNREAGFGRLSTLHLEMIEEEFPMYRAFVEVVRCQDGGENRHVRLHLRLHQGGNHRLFVCCRDSLVDERQN